MRVRLLAIFAVTVTFSARPAFADPPASAAPSEALPETADSLYNKGNDAFDGKDYALAYELYVGAFKLRKSYDIARNLGLAELRLGKFTEAIAHFSYSLSLYPSNRADTKQQVVEWLAEAMAEVGTVRLRVEPESAVCRVNGRPLALGEAENDILVNPGDVNVECGGLDGYRPGKRAVTVKKGARAEVAIKLAATAPGPGKDPGPSGPLLSPEARRTVLWVGAAASVASLGAGAVTGILSLGKADEANALLGELKASTGQESPCVAGAGGQCAALRALRKEQDLLGNTAFWTLLAGGVAGAGTAAFGLATRSRAAAPPAAVKAAIVPVIGPGTAALVLSGSW